MFLQFIADIVFAASSVFYFVCFMSADKQQHLRADQWFNTFMLHLCLGGIPFLGANLAWIMGSGNVRSGLAALLVIIAVTLTSPFFTGAITTADLKGQH